MYIIFRKWATADKATTIDEIDRQWEDWNSQPLDSKAHDINRMTYPGNFFAGYHAFHFQKLSFSSSVLNAKE